eukprot:jgi/Botrbrau1/18108/Bobra.0508s0003.1
MKGSMPASWAILPPDVQRRIVACLSLPDLAKVAPTSRAFYDEYLACCQADGARLPQIAYSMFGQRLISKLLEALCYPDREPHARQGQAVGHLRPGAPQQGDPFRRGGSSPTDLVISEADLRSDLYAHLELRDAKLDAPARGLHGPGHDTKVTWRLFWQHGARFLQLEWGGGVLLKLLCRPGVTLQAYIKPYPWLEEPSVCVEVLPLLSVGHLACKMAAESPLPSASHIRQARQPATRYAADWWYCGTALFTLGYELRVPDVMWSGAGQFVEGDVQWGLSTLHMWNRRFWQSPLEFRLYLAVPPKTWQSRTILRWVGVASTPYTYFPHDLIRLTLKSPNHRDCEVTKDGLFEVSEVWKWV